MCGILVTNDVNMLKTLDYNIKIRGPNSFCQYKFENFTFLQTVLSIREPVREMYIDKMNNSNILILYNGEIFKNVASDMEYIITAAIESFKSEELHFGDKLSKQSNYEQIHVVQKNINSRKKMCINFFNCQILHKELNKNEGEYAIVIYDKIYKQIFFFTDDIGRKSLGFNLTSNQIHDTDLNNVDTKFMTYRNYFTISSSGCNSIVNPSFLYCYDLQTNKLLLQHKTGKKLFSYSEYKLDENTFFFELALSEQKVFNSRSPHSDIFIKNKLCKNLQKISNNDFLNAIFNNFTKLLYDSTKCRTNDLIKNKSISISFSGGIDSFITVINLDLVLPYNINFYLINTFISNESFDHVQAKINFYALEKKFERKIKLIENRLNITVINEHIRTIHKLVQSQDNTHMNLNIGVIHYFTAMKAKQFGKILFTGNGADEIFMGYHKYNKKHSIANNEYKQPLINIDLFKSNICNLYKQNIFRDDRVISYNQVEMRSIFLDSKLISFIINLVFNEKSKYQIKIFQYTFVQNHLKLSAYNNSEILYELFVDEKENKKLLRHFLRMCGYEEQSYIKKKAMQFGSGLKKCEKQINY